MNNFLKISLVVICMNVPLKASSQEPNKTNKLSCSARHLDTNEEVKVKTESGLSINNKVATAQWPLGYPTIAIDDSAFTKLPGNAKQFIYYHECAHLALRTTDEKEADCESINTMIKKHGATKHDIRILVKTLAKEFGLSPRWTNLLKCESFPQ